VDREGVTLRREDELFDKIRRHLGVEYVYAEEESVRAPTLGLAEAVAGLPDEWIHELREAISNGEKDRRVRVCRHVILCHSKITCYCRARADQPQCEDRAKPPPTGGHCSVSTNLLLPEHITTECKIQLNCSTKWHFICQGVTWNSKPPNPKRKLFWSSMMKKRS
jgi:hypothetical protein